MYRLKAFCLWLLILAPYGLPCLMPCSGTNVSYSCLSIASKCSFLICCENMQPGMTHKVVILFASIAAWILSSVGA